MTEDHEAAEVAKGLSKTQAAAMLGSNDRWQNAKEIGAAGGSTLRSLCWYWPKGADPISPCVCLMDRDYEDMPLRYIYRLNAFGLRVRAHLQGETA